MVIFSIHGHESPMDTHVSAHPEPLSDLPPHPIHLGCPRALALSALLHTLNLHWSSILQIAIFVIQCYCLKSSHPRLLPHSPKFVLYNCVSFAAIHIGSSLLSF